MSLPRFVVLAYNSHGAVAVFGTATGAFFRSELSAQKARRRYERKHPTVQTLVLPVEARDDD